ncbi:hypothetical protein N9152_00735 [bacterium]|nr:hypothetical protein [bacterium]
MSNQNITIGLNTPEFSGNTPYGNTSYLRDLADLGGVLQNIGVNTEQPSGGFFGDILGGLRDIGSAVSPAIPAIAGSLLTSEAYDRLSDVGRQAEASAMGLAERGLAESQFKPFTVTSTTGGQLGTRVTPSGAVETTMGLSPQEQAMQQQLLGGAGDFFGQAQMPTVAREQAIFERMRAAQRPEEERQRLALEERLAGQGRLGVSSAAYGGATPEQLAMATAQEEGRNRAMLGAMQQAQAEQMQQAGLGQQFLGAGYVPQAQLLAATQPAQRLAELQQQAQLYGTGLFGETAMSGIESRLLAEQARANLLGGVGSNILAGMFTPQVNQRTGDVTSAGGLGDLGGLFGGVSEGLGTIIRGIGGIFD